MAAYVDKSDDTENKIKVDPLLYWVSSFEGNFDPGADILNKAPISRIWHIQTSYSCMNHSCYYAYKHILSLVYYINAL